MAQQSQPDDAEQILLRTIEIAEQNDSFAAIGFLQEHGEPAEVAQAYSKLLQKLYFEKKSIPLMITFGRSGIQYSLEQAELLASSDAEQAKQLRGIAKTIAFNLAANAWPGWNDDGIVITARDLLDGRDAARLNLRLAQELDRDDDVLGNAHWLLGAQLIAANRSKEAVEQLNEATKYFSSAKKQEFVEMVAGYVGIALMTDPAKRQSGQQQFDKAIKQLKEIGSDDAKFFAEQLQTAHTVFVK